MRSTWVHVVLEAKSGPGEDAAACCMQVEALEYWLTAYGVHRSRTGSHTHTLQCARLDPTTHQHCSFSFPRVVTSVRAYALQFTCAAEICTAWRISETCQIDMAHFAREGLVGHESALEHDGMKCRNRSKRPELTFTPSLSSHPRFVGAILVYTSRLSGVPWFHRRWMSAGNMVFRLSGG